MINSTAVTALIVVLGLAIFSTDVLAQRPRRRRMSLPQQEEKALADGFTGLTTDGKVIADLFRIKSTGVTTEPVREAAEKFIEGLTDQQRKATVFKVDDSEWRKWANQHHYQRQGVSFSDMNEAQRELAFKLFAASLSARGLQTTRDIMRLNETLAELKNDWNEYGEWLYHITIMGTPSATEPWGWQLDGHHVVINYFVLGDQVVMSPFFMGSEPVTATTGKYKGTTVLQQEQDLGLAFMRSLSKEHRQGALVRGEKGPTNNLAEAFKDNLIVENVGIQASELDDNAKKRLVDLVAVYANHMKEGHARVKLAEVESHIDDTYFAWIGSTEDDSVYYYRIQSPVIYIEFDHQRPIALARSRVPTRDHIHVVVRTPNGNDYGKDLLRQHYEHHHKDQE